MVSEEQVLEALSKAGTVLILVLVEDGLGEYKNQIKLLKGASLNPCFSGRWSRSLKAAVQVLPKRAVLILVLVEDGLGDGPYVEIGGHPIGVS